MEEFRDVSILVLMDTLLLLEQRTVVEGLESVSILVLMDTLLLRENNTNE